MYCYGYWGVVLVVGECVVVCCVFGVWESMGRCCVNGEGFFGVGCGYYCYFEWRSVGEIVWCRVCGVDVV